MQPSVFTLSLYTTSSDVLLTLLNLHQQADWEVRVFSQSLQTNSCSITYYQLVRYTSSNPQPSWSLQFIQILLISTYLLRWIKHCVDYYCTILHLRHFIVPLLSPRYWDFSIRKHIFNSKPSAWSHRKGRSLLKVVRSVCRFLGGGGRCLCLILTQHLIYITTAISKTGLWSLCFAQIASCHVSLYLRYKQAGI